MHFTRVRIIKTGAAAFVASLMLAGLPLVGCSAPAEEPQKEPEPVVEPEPEPKQEEPKETEKPQAESSATALTGAVLPSATSAESPAPIGQPVEIGIYSTDDKLYHSVLVSIDKVTTTADDSAYVEQYFADHNAVASDFMQIDLASAELPDDVEICVVDYTITVPEEFNAGEFGIGTLQQSFNASNPEGGGIPTKGGTYVGMGLVDKLLTEADARYMPGNTYQLRGYFTMVKGYTDYVFDLTTYPEGTSNDDLTGKMEHAYFASH